MGNITTQENREWAIPHEDATELAEKALRSMLILALAALDNHDITTLENIKFELTHKATTYLGELEYEDACRKAERNGLVF